jgi:hypothetical protein
MPLSRESRARDGSGGPRPRFPATSFAAEAIRMPLVGFKPNKARLIIEQGNETILVLRIVAARDERVLLATGGNLQSLIGVLRIREHSDRRSAKSGRATGSIVHIPAVGNGADARPARFQINIAMSAEKFDMMMRLAAAGKLPAKFFVDIAGRPGALGARGFGYVMRGGRKVKFWDTARHRQLPVTNFTMILPVEMHDPGVDPWDDAETQASAPASPATNVQVAELADDLLVFQSETKHMLNGLVIAVVVICVLIGLINLYPLFR